MRLLLALRCFFLVLFGGRLPDEARALLPAPAEPEPPPAPEPPAVDEAALRAEGAVLLLGVLQREGRLLDFLQEEVEGFSDAQIGAAVRDIHRGCKKALGEHLTIAPVLAEADGATVKVEAGFDPARIRLVGNVTGQPPFFGALRHPGWRATEVRLPEAESGDRRVIAPAEVEL